MAWQAPDDHTSERARRGTHEEDEAGDQLDETHGEIVPRPTWRKSTLFTPHRNTQSDIMLLQWHSWSALRTERRSW